MASLIGPLAFSWCLVADPMTSTRSRHSEATTSLPPSLERLYHWWSRSCPYSVQLMPVQLWPTELRSVFKDAVVMEQRRIELLHEERPHRNNDWIRVCAIFDGVWLYVGAAEGIVGRRMEECSSLDALSAFFSSGEGWRSQSSSFTLPQMPKGGLL